MSKYMAPILFGLLMALGQSVAAHTPDAQLIADCEAKLQEHADAGKSTVRWQSVLDTLQDKNPASPVTVEEVKRYAHNNRHKPVGALWNRVAAHLEAHSAPPPPIPGASISADPVSVEIGEPSTLTWTTEHASSAVLNSENVDLSGSKDVTPDTTTDYVLSAYGDGGSTQVSATVTVTLPRAQQSDTQQSDTGSWKWDGTWPYEISEDHELYYFEIVAIASNNFNSVACLQGELPTDRMWLEYAEDAGGLPKGTVLKSSGICSPGWGLPDSNGCGGFACKKINVIGSPVDDNVVQANREYPLQVQSVIDGALATTDTQNLVVVEDDQWRASVSKQRGGCAEYEIDDPNDGRPAKCIRRHPSKLVFGTTKPLVTACGTRHDLVNDDGSCAEGNASYRFPPRPGVGLVDIDIRCVGPGCEKDQVGRQPVERPYERITVECSSDPNNPLGTVLKSCDCGRGKATLSFTLDFNINVSQSVWPNEHSKDYAWPDQSQIVFSPATLDWCSS